MKNWKGYNVLDLTLILVGVITVTTTSIIFHSPWYIIFNTILGLLYVFTQAKGKIATQFLGIIYFCFYISIAYMQKYYGEAILYLTIMLPMYIYGCFHWLMNRDKNKRDIVLIRENLSKKEWLISSFCFILLSIVIFFVLKSLNTSQLVVNTLSFVTMLPAVYLLVRRYKWNHIAFLLNDFIVPLLWVFLVIDGKKEFVSMCIYHIFQISYDIYGLIEWVKLEKKQKSLMKNDNKMNEDKIQKNIVGKCL